MTSRAGFVTDGLALKGIRAILHIGVIFAVLSGGPVDAEADNYAESGYETAVTVLDNYVRIKTLDSEMAYLDVGEGAPIVFLHGNPTSSFIWRNVLPHLVREWRVLAPDLIGYGRSGKSPSKSYRFVHHADYLDAWFEQVVPEGRVILVGQDWGVQLLMDWANRNRERVRAIVYTEGTVRPRRWDQFPEVTQKLFRMMRDKSKTDQLLESNVMVEKGLLNAFNRRLTAQEKAIYMAPFLSPADRLPTVMLARDLPLDGEPEDVAKRVAAYAQWMENNDIPKLFFNATKGVAIVGEDLDYVRSWRNQKEVLLNGGHHLPEDAPHEMGKAIARWAANLERE